MPDPLAAGGLNPARFAIGRNGALIAKLMGVVLASIPAAAEARALFADESVMRIRIEAPIERIMRSASSSTEPQSGRIRVDPTGESHSIRIAARGLSRRRRESCSFAPLRIQFEAPPPAGSLFEGQSRLKLVTHCRREPGFQQHILLEYAAYRLLNVLTPRSFRVRLAQVDYVEPGQSQASLSRQAFFIEDVDDVARRNGLTEVEARTLRFQQLSAEHTARFGLFQYMIGNLDWSAQTPAPGRECCHNAKLLGARADSTSGLVPVPYDFDQAGMIDTPYAVVPSQYRLRSVRDRRYRGYCIHQRETLAAAAQVRASRLSLERAIVEIPGMDDGIRRGALRYLNLFFQDLESDRTIARRLFEHCRNSGD